MTKAGNQLSTTLSNDGGRFELPLNKSEYPPYRIVFRKPEYEEAVYRLADMLTTRNVTVELVREPEIRMGKLIARNAVER